MSKKPIIVIVIFVLVLSVAAFLYTQRISMQSVSEVEVSGNKAATPAGDGSLAGEKTEPVVFHLADENPTVGAVAHTTTDDSVSFMPTVAEQTSNAEVSSWPEVNAADSYRQWLSERAEQAAEKPLNNTISIVDARDPDRNRDGSDLLRKLQEDFLSQFPTPAEKLEQFDALSPEEQERFVSERMYLPKLDVRTLPEGSGTLDLDTLTSYTVQGGVLVENEPVGSGALDLSTFYTVPGGVFVETYELDD